MMFVDYDIAKECKTPEAYICCHKCGRCGRIFNSEGFMIDSGGTHPDFEDKEDYEEI